MRTIPLLVLSWIISITLQAQGTEHHPHWNVLKSNPSSDQLASVVFALEQDIAAHQTGDNTELTGLLQYAAHIATEVQDYDLAARTLEILHRNNLSTDPMLSLTIARNITAELKLSKHMPYTEYSDKMCKAMQYYGSYLNSHPDNFDVYYGIAGMHYNFFAYLQANRLYQHQLNMDALVTSENYLDKALNVQPENTDAIELRNSVRDMLGVDETRK